MSASPDFSLICNGKEMAVSVNSETLLKTFPRGPYTTARTHDINSVFEFDFHNSRIAESTKLMVEAGTLNAPKELSKLIQPETLRDEYLDNVRKAVALYKESHPQTGEMKLTTLLAVDDAKDHQLYVHVQALGDRPEKPVKIQIMGAPRSNAAAKDSAWISSRQGLWDAREEAVHEVVLCNDEGTLFEGLSSNFFVLVRDEEGAPVLYTAREGVLLGTVRDLALKLCPQLNIKVIEEPPSMKELERAEEVFISSTSRWVLPVGEMVMADKTIVATKSTELTDKLYRLLLDNVVANSTPL
eukprot:CAMPEP_0179459044 /NCGR_PEP_ID=MMETSP0799-20121207/42447_1 /TAXON_ID=46947 /ORGANISM="Geminigera cryophila, Strain CCMP2564" /LENGTH=298 /DNA_ID=CAMNT_0021260607 /DNA_START=159 /DNA_END=1055 /DNA_ORIENTATION=-